MARSSKRNLGSRITFTAELLKRGWGEELGPVFES